MSANLPPSSAPHHTPPGDSDSDEFGSGQSACDQFGSGESAATIGTGRYAPSPTSDLHLGNLRTALLSWLFARTTGRRFHLRMEDLDQTRTRSAGDIARRQLADLAALGLDHDGPVRWQSTRLAAYAEAAASLDTYECFCSRRDIAEASQAPHGGLRPYPGTCRELTASQRLDRGRVRPAALRVRVRSGMTMAVEDALSGVVRGPVDDFVIRRGDGTWAYNLAVVVDDLEAGVDQVVRGDDLLSSAPRQAWLATELGGRPPHYVHVPLAVNAAGNRLAKRDGAVSMTDLGWPPERVLAELAASLGLAAAEDRITARDLLPRFDPGRLPRTPWVPDIGGGA